MDASIDRNIANRNRLIVRLNAFTHKIDDGYLMSHGRRIGNLMTPAEIGAFIAANPEHPVEFLNT